MTIKESNEQKKEYLNQYKLICRKIKSLEEQEKFIRSEMDGARAIGYSDMPGVCRQNDISDYMIKLENIAQRISNERKRRQQIILDIELCVAEVEDGTESKLLHDKYIKQMTWEQVSKSIGYSWKQTHRIHSMALQHLNIEKQNMT